MSEERRAVARLLGKKNRVMWSIDHMTFYSNRITTILFIKRLIMKGNF